MRDLLLFFGYAIFSWAVFQSLALGIMQLSGFELDIDHLATAATARELSQLKLFQAISTIGTFMVPTFLFVYLKRKKQDYLRLKSGFDFRFLGVSLFAMVLAFPTLEYIIAWNESITFPEAGFLSQVGDFLTAQEKRAGQLTKALTSGGSGLDLTINLIVLAVLPALGEELFFRGGLQNILGERYNKHVAIWITAFLFSLFHFQFFGFVPRMLFGALFGYLYVWGRSLWYPIICHVGNNAVALIAIHFSGNQVSNSMESPWWVMAGTLPILVLLLWQVGKQKTPA